MREMVDLKQQGPVDNAVGEKRSLRLELPPHF